MLQNERAHRGWPSCIYQGEPTAQEPALTFRDCAPPEPPGVTHPGPPTIRTPSGLGTLISYPNDRSAGRHSMDLTQRDLMEAACWFDSDKAVSRLSRRWRR